MWVYYLIGVGMCLLGAFGSFFLKRASKFDSILSLIKNYNFYLGGGLYFASALVNIYLLTKLDYIVVLPLTSITYIFTMLISWLILKEKMSLKKIIGILCIVAGVILIAI